MKIIRLLAVVSTLAMMVSGISCRPGTKTSPVVTPASTPSININYSGNFDGQTASGSLKLVVDLIIENAGFESFNTSPDNFSVTVEGYSYNAVENDLQTVELANGEKISGKLTFQVPPVAATTRVGYQIEHSGQTLHNIQWLKQTSSPVSTTVSSPVVSISYSGTLMWIKEKSSLYLVLDVNIENRGYESFNTSPVYFTLDIGNIIGQSEPTPPISYDGALSENRDGAYSDLRSYDLQNGGKISGKLAFKVPTSILAATQSYKLIYSGVREYNIQWSMKPPQE